MLNNPVCGFLEALLITGSEQGVQQNVIRLQGGVGFEFAAPIASLVPRGEKKLARGTDRDADSISQTLDLAEAKLWSGTQNCVRGVFVHTVRGSVNPR